MHSPVWCGRVSVIKAHPVHKDGQVAIPESFAAEGGAAADPPGGGGDRGALANPPALPTFHSLCSGRPIDKVILLVRHPFAATWAEVHCGEWSDRRIDRGRTRRTVVVRCASAAARRRLATADRHIRARWTTARRTSQSVPRVTHPATTTKHVRLDAFVVARVHRRAARSTCATRPIGQR